MHSRIFQVNTKPIKKSDYIDIDDVFNELDMDYCDEIDNDFRADIDWLLDVMPDGVFSWDGKSRHIVYSGDVVPILDMWQKSVDDAYNGVQSNIIDSMGRFRLRARIKRPLGDFMFHIEQWTGNCAVSSDEFVEWLCRLTPGAKIHIGAILDYHF